MVDSLVYPHKADRKPVKMTIGKEDLMMRKRKILLGYLHVLIVLRLVLM